MGARMTPAYIYSATATNTVMAVSIHHLNARTALHADHAISAPHARAVPASAPPLAPRVQRKMRNAHTTRTAALSIIARIIMINALNVKIKMTHVIGTMNAVMIILARVMVIVFVVQRNMRNVQTTMTAALTIIARIIMINVLNVKCLIVQRTMNAAKTTNA